MGTAIVYKRYNLFSFVLGKISMVRTGDLEVGNLLQKTEGSLAGHPFPGTQQENLVSPFCEMAAEIRHEISCRGSGSHPETQKSCTKYHTYAIWI